MKNISTYAWMLVASCFLLTTSPNCFAQSQLVRFDSNFGKFEIELFDNTPLTGANFLTYVDSGDYDNTYVHRLATGFVVQAGGFSLEGNSLGIVTRRDPVQNEPFNSNIRGTVSLAKTANNPDSGTNQFFFNLSDDNAGPPASLDTQNGGFTAFARVTADGMDIIDQIAALTPFNVSSQLNDIYNIDFGDTFATVPLTEAVLSPENFIVYSRVDRVDDFLGDLDGSGAITGADIDLLYAAYGATPANDFDLDLDSDGNVGDSDRDRLIESIAETRLGDLNFDGRVDVLNDAFALVGNIGTSSGATYAQGDVNGDGQVNVLGDAFPLVGNIGFGSSSSSPSAAAVPEPSSFGFSILAAIGLFSLRQRKSTV
jgi:cyclophilin family peptidyl-prolyl cis-trans isomerase